VRCCGAGVRTDDAGQPRGQPLVGDCHAGLQPGHRSTDRLALTGDGTASPCRRRCNRSSWSMARYNWRSMMVSWRKMRSWDFGIAAQQRNSGRLSSRDLLVRIPPGVAYLTVLQPLCFAPLPRGFQIRFSASIRWPRRRGATLPVIPCTRSWTFSGLMEHRFCYSSSTPGWHKVPRGPSTDFIWPAGQFARSAYARLGLNIR